MKLNSKLTGGLAWAGLIIILAVPSADMLTKGGGNKAATMTSDMTAVETAGVAPVAAPATAPRVVLARPGEEPEIIPAQNEDPVEEYLSSGKELPSYISDAPAELATGEAAPVPQLVAPKLDAPAPVDVAAVAADTPVANAGQVAPLPYPASMRPSPAATPAPTIAPVTTLAPVTTASAAPATAPATTLGEPVVIVDEDLVARREAAVANVLDDEPSEFEDPSVVSEEELEEWDSGSLAEYLERRNLISGGGDEASTDFEDDFDSEFDDDGFFLDEGPNTDRPRRRLRRELEFF